MGEAAGNKLLVEQALESREVRGTKSRCEKFTGKKRINCEKKRRRSRKQKNRKSLKSKKTSQRNQDCPKGKTLNKTGKKCARQRKRRRERHGTKLKRNVSEQGPDRVNRKQIAKRTKKQGNVSKKKGNQGKKSKEIRVGIQTLTERRQ